MPILIVHLPGLQPVSHTVNDEITTIGRMKGNSIVIEDPSISLMHARITRKNGGFYFKDLNSTNGSLINGQPVSEAKLSDQDRVQLADVSAQFVAELVQPNAARSSGSDLALRSESVGSFPASLSPSPGIILADSSRGDEARTAAPGPITSAGAKLKKIEPLRAPTSNGSRIASVISAGIGVLAALAVLSFMGWRFAHLHDPEVATVDVQSPGQTAPNPEAVAPQAVDVPPPLPTVSVIEPVPTQDVAELASRLISPNLLERRLAAKALHSLGLEARQAAEGLREALEDTDDQVRMWSALALVNSQQYDKRAVPILIHVLQNEDSVLRQVACLSLALVPYEEAEKDLVVPALAELAGKDLDDSVRRAARSALNIIEPDLYGKAETPKP